MGKRIKRTALKPYFDKYLIEAGCDEAGRGCLSGPVVAAAVIFPKKFRNKEIRDSKLLSHKKKNELRTVIQENAIAWSVAYVSQQEIDDINILNASYKSMHKAIHKLSVEPELLLIDGNRFNSFPNIPHQCIIKGDNIYLSIAAASILAKTYRDEYMAGIHKKHPHYNWVKNKGYATLEHRTAVIKDGLSPYHRKTFCRKILNKTTDSR